jgi:hypothetical protein
MGDSYTEVYGLSDFAPGVSGPQLEGRKSSSGNAAIDMGQRGVLAGATFPGGGGVADEAKHQAETASGMIKGKQSRSMTRAGPIRETAIMCRLKLERIADFRPKCSNANRQSRTPGKWCVIGS